MKVDGFQRLIRQNVRGRSLFQKALLCFCISASLQAVKAIPTIGDFESLSGRRWERVERRRSRKWCLLEARYIAQWNSGENLICLHVRTPSLALILREIAMPTNGGIGRLTHVGLSQIFEQNMKVDGFQRSIRQNVRGQKLYQKALLCFCISASLQGVKTTPTIVDFDRRWWEKAEAARIWETVPPSCQIACPLKFY